MVGGGNAFSEGLGKLVLGALLGCTLGFCFVQYLVVWESQLDLRRAERFAKPGPSNSGQAGGCRCSRNPAKSPIVGPYSGS